jgi:heat shock protein HtpX
MYSQISRNKRLSIIYTVLFFLVWTGVGVGVGAIWVVASRPAPNYPIDTVRYLVMGGVIAALLAVAGIAFSWSSGSKMVLSVSGARPADRSQYLALYNIVEALAIGGGLVVPAVYVINDPSPNAFATGSGPAKAAITVTTGLLATMNREELEGVISHEMSHIKNYDIRLLLIVSTLIGMAALIASIIFRSMLFMRGGRGRNGGMIILVVIAAGAAFGVVAMVFGPIVKLALSRRREELADVSGVQLTRNPAGLISALKKLQANDKPFAKFNHATAAMCIDDPLQHHESGWHQLFATHPPIAERIAVLEGIASGSSL